MTSGRHRSEPEWIDLNFDSAEQPPPAAAWVAAPVGGLRIEAEGVRYARVGRQILDDVSLTARPGRVMALTGPSGSGKSSLIALMAGLERPDSGTVRVDGAPLTGLLPGAGLILQAYGLVSVLSAAENVEVTLQVGPRRSKGEVFDRARSALDAVGLLDVGDHLVEELSGGQQQRVAVARALVLAPSVLLADEPTAELDHDSKERVLTLILGLARQGATVVLATHDLEVAARCDDQVRLVDGRVAP